MNKLIVPRGVFVDDTPSSEPTRLRLNKRPEVEILKSSLLSIKGEYFEANGYVNFPLRASGEYKDIGVSLPCADGDKEWVVVIDSKNRATLLHRKVSQP